MMSHSVYTLLNIGLLILFVLFLFLLTNSKWASFSIASILLVILGVATKIKVNYRGVGFTLTDIFLLGEAAQMSDVLPGSFIASVILLSLITLLILFSLIYLMDKPKFSANGRLTISFIILAVFFTFYSLSPQISITKDGDINRTIRVEECGSFYYFLINLNNPVKIKAPDEEIIETTFPPLPEIETTADIIKPDIIMIQSEAFSDPTVIGLDQFSGDPIPFFHSLKEESDYFNLIVPAYGGGTANTEFETLTGLSTAFFPQDLTVFSGYLNGNTISLGSILRNQGYTTEIVHPFNGIYYRRDLAYRFLGFNGMKDIDDLMESEHFSENSKKESSYTDDRALFAETITTLEENNTSPNFILNVSMQNHSPYSDIHNSFNYDVHYTGESLSAEEIVPFDRYLKGIKNSDEALKELVTYLKERDKPTMLIIFGDHLPSINGDPGFHTNLGLVADENLLEKDNLLHQTPCLIWRNYDSPTPIKEDNEDPMDAMYLADRILSKTELNRPNYFQILTSLRQEEGVSSFSSQYLIKNGEFFDQETDTYKEYYDKLLLLNGDILKGAKYLEDDLNNFIVKDNTDFDPPSAAE